MRGLNCRGVRLERFAVLGLALAMPALAAASTQATQTRLTAETRDQNGRTQAAFAPGRILNRERLFNDVENSLDFEPRETPWP